MLVTAFDRKLRLSFHLSRRAVERIQATIKDFLEYIPSVVELLDPTVRRCRFDVAM